MGDLRISLREIRDDGMLRTMADVFEKQAENNSNKIGLIVGANSYKYSEINDKSNEVAAGIKFFTDNNPSNTERIIALFLDRTEEIIFGILGAWKAGVAYVPIDPNYPQGRINSIIDDCNPLLILTDTNSKSKLPSTRIQIMDIMNISIPSSDGNQIRNHIRNGKDLAIVIYTSGTTGRPKGVMIQHNALVNQCLDYPIRYPDLANDEVVVSLFNYAFNAFMEPVTLAYSQGFSLVIVPYQLLLNPGNLMKYFIEHGITHIDGTPSLASQYDLSKVKTLKRIAVGGEPLTHAHLSAFLSRNPSIRVFNIYGNSEGTLCTLTQDSTDGQLEFGREVHGKRVHLLNENLQPVPIGTIGEICLVGKGVAQGYWKNPSLTAEKFINNSEYGGRMYRTGDLGVRNSNGGIIYVGRKDLQVKIRGIRVEIAEIEYTILKMSDAIDRTAVICDSSVEGNQLIGYYSIASNHSQDSVNEKEILKYLRKQLPEYMIPIRMYFLEEFPITGNGKVNREELKPPANESFNGSYDVADGGIEREGYTKREITLCELWEDVLSLPRNTVERNSNFFSLGGNSLLAIKIISMIKESLGIELNSVRIMEKGGGFASFLEEEPPSGSVENDVPQFIIPVRDSSIRNPSPSTSQERILQSGTQEIFIFEFESGDERNGNIEEFLTAIENVVERFEILRTIYPPSRFGMRSQKINQISTQIRHICRSSPKTIKEDKKNFLKEGISITSVGPIKIGIFELEETNKEIMVLIHGIALDSVSAVSFLEELKSKANSNNNFAEPLQYADFAVFQRNFLPDEDGKALVNHWKEMLSNPSSDSSTNASSESNVTSSVDVTLNINLRSQLQVLASKCGVSLNTVFLAAHVLLVHSIEPAGFDITTSVLISGRTHPQLYSTLGNFSQMLPITLSFSPDDDTLKKFIQNVDEKITSFKNIQKHFPIDVSAAAIGIKKMLSHPYFRYVFDLTNSMSYDTEFEVKSVKFCGIQKEIQELGKGIQFMTSIDSSSGFTQGKIVAINENLAEFGKNNLCEILEKMKMENSDIQIKNFIKN